MTVQIARRDAWMPEKRRGERLAFAVVDYGGSKPVVRLFDTLRGRKFYLDALARLNNGRLMHIGWVTFK